MTDHLGQLGGPWVAAERVSVQGGTPVYRRHPDSPEFTDVGSLMDWLEARGLITPPDDPHGDRGYAGWGDPWYAVPTDRAVLRCLSI